MLISYTLTTLFISIRSDIYKTGASVLVRAAQEMWDRIDDLVLLRDHFYNNKAKEEQ